ncbi:hypothetical protein LG52_1172 [Geobacillus kaustophilus]|uniref:Uncharacterized protein n=1 Tax=Geobacillus kaustophilus TaxID=1462 RepID=A0A0D8BVI7_GEOKU|nr:hypothetical protein LG52_1172 [Geobacillus kaustophilus]
MYSFTDERAMGKRFVFHHCLLSKQWKNVFEIMFTGLPNEYESIICPT